MQEEPTGFERPGEQQPAAGEPTPPPPPPQGLPQPPPQSGPGGPGTPGGAGGPGQSGPGGQAGGPGQTGSPGPQGGPGGPGHPGGPAYTYPPHGSYPPPAERRLTRRMDNRVLAGVASGLGTYFGVDPVIFRIGFVVLTLAGGTGVLMYLLLWALLPAASYGGVAGPSPGPPAGDPPILTALRQGGPKRYLAIGAAILAALLLAGPFARPTVVFALLLIGVGVLLMLQDRPAAPGSAPPWPPGPPAPPAGGGQQAGEPWQQRGPWQQPPGSSQPHQGPGADPSSAASATTTQPVAFQDVHPGWEAATGRIPGGQWDPGTGAPSAQTTWGHGRAPVGWGAAPTGVAERKPRPRAVLGWVTVAAALLAAGVASALDNFGVVSLTPGRIVALVLTVVGVGLLVGSVWGRAWWLILLGLVLVPAMAVTSVASDVPVSGRTGEQTEQPVAVAEVQREYRLAAGDFTLDLRQVDFGAQPHHVRVRMGAGNMRVIVPRDQPVTVTSRINAGELSVLGQPTNSGLQPHSTVNGNGNPELGHLTLDLRLGVGQIVVTRGS
jgi:phage shock protein PspC (stress-responsive transcriptional regulator)